MPEIHQILIARSIEDVAREFASLLTPPFPDDVENDRERRFEQINIRMAYFNNDQIPIPRETTTSDVVAGLIRDAARKVSIIGRTVPERFVGSRSLWDQSPSLSGEHFSPFLVIEESNDCNVGVYELNVAEIAPVLGEDTESTRELIDILARDYENQGAVVITYSYEISQAHADWEALMDEMSSTVADDESDS